MTKKIYLPDVTLLAASSVDLDNTQLALRISRLNIDFGAVKLLSHARPSHTAPNIEYIAIPPMDFAGYSRFMLEDLYKYVDTSHCLVVQADGFVLHAELWRDEFLEYDYVGAPWPESVLLQPGSQILCFGSNRVGNGGFSLRSRKLLGVTAQIKFDSLDFPVKSEDLVICHYLYNEMTAKGIRFAPPELAARFAIEATDNLYGQNIGSVFGFHGKHWRDALLRNTEQNHFIEALLRTAEFMPQSIRQ